MLKIHTCGGLGTQRGGVPTNYQPKCEGIFRVFIASSSDFSLRIPSRVKKFRVPLIK
jgi:hypothetical protein